MEEEKRAAPRHRTLKGARIAFHDGFSTIECTVRNMSDIGAMLKVASVIGIPDHFDLVLSDGQKFTCTVARRTATEVGVTFG